MDQYERKKQMPRYIMGNAGCLSVESFHAFTRKYQTYIKVETLVEADDMA